MPRVTRLLDHSLASTVSPGLAERRIREIKDMPCAPKRWGALAIQKFVMDDPVRTGRLLNWQAQKNGYQFVGTGADAAIYRRGLEVTKVIRSTVGQPDQLQAAVARNRTNSFAQVARSFGGFVLDQVTTIAEHPVPHYGPVVQTRQPYVDFMPLGLVTVDAAEVDRSALSRLAANFPSIIGDLGRFAAASEQFRSQTGMLPDLNGRDNLVVDLSSDSTPHLRLIDTDPVPKEHSDTQHLVSLQLRSLQNALQAVA